MKSILWALAYFFIGYLIATVVGFATWFISETVMWLTIFIAMPCVFGVLAYTYLSRTGCKGPEAGIEAVRLITFWMGCSFALDALTYIGILPMMSGIPPNFHFFQDQSPWIWLSYLALILSGFGAVFALRRRQSPSAS